MSNPTPPHTAVRIWDLPTRLFHWLLACLVIALIVTGSLGGVWLEWHMRAGEAALALLLFRLVWGFAGGYWSRFARFVYSPRRLIAYLQGRPHPHDDAGHSPTGALSVFALLLVLLAQAITGLFANDDIAFSGPLSHLVSGHVVELLTGWHKLAKPVILALVVLHVAAIAYYRIVRKRALTMPMLTGDKPLPVSVPASRDTLATRLLALVLLLLLCALMAWIDSLGAAALGGVY